MGGIEKLLNIKDLYEYMSMIIWRGYTGFDSILTEYRNCWLGASMEANGMFFYFIKSIDVCPIWYLSE